MADECETDGLCPALWVSVGPLPRLAAHTMPHNAIVIVKNLVRSLPLQDPPTMQRTRKFNERVLN